MAIGCEAQPAAAEAVGLTAFCGPPNPGQAGLNRAKRSQHEKTAPPRWVGGALGAAGNPAQPRPRVAVCYNAGCALSVVRQLGPIVLGIDDESVRLWLGRFQT